MAYFSSKMVSRHVKLPKHYKLLEVLAINATINNNDVLFVGIYRTPKATGTDYYRKLEEEFNSLCMWATMECNTLILTGDLNLDRLRPERTEGKILLSLEEVYGLECLIKDPTRITPTSETLLDVILTNKPELFKTSGVLNPEMSDHHLVYWIMKERVSQHERKVVTFRSTRTLDVEKLNEDLSCAPWNVMDTFDTLDEKYLLWESLLNTIVEKHMPTKRMRFRKVDVPYMTPEWKRAIKMKRIVDRCLVFVGPSEKVMNLTPSSSFSMEKSSTIMSWCSCRPRKPKCIVSSHHIVFIKERGVWLPNWPFCHSISSSSFVRLFALLLCFAFCFVFPSLVRAAFSPSLPRLSSKTGTLYPYLRRMAFQRNHSA